MVELINNYGLLFFVYAHLGWLMEVAYAYTKQGKFVNRGFMYGPFCPIYGTGAIVIISFAAAINLMIPPSPYAHLLVVISIVLLTTAIELITGGVLEKLFHIKWWDYSTRRFNYKGYICLQFSLIWGAVGALLVYVINPWVYAHLAIIPAVWQYTLEGLLAAYFVWDATRTVMGLINLRKLIMEFEAVSSQIRKTWRTALETELAELSKGIETELAELSRGLETEFAAFNREFEADLDEARRRFREELQEHRVDIIMKQLEQDLGQKRRQLRTRILKARQFNAFPEFKMFELPDLPENTLIEKIHQRIQAKIDNKD
ncbi:MAG: hypothetical protein PWP38_1112 [Clostridiales bacterium]|nr:hypothetical protein [Clostridiales bacterium]